MSSTCHRKKAGGSSNHLIRWDYSMPVAAEPDETMIHLITDNS
jgi:hypothetical protein